MDWIEALILGIIQGLTEYLPVSSSGHLAIGQALFGMQDGEENLMFTVAVHVATILSTLVVLWKEISWIVKGVFKFEMNAETKYFLNIVVSMIPVGIVGLFFKDQVEEIFGSGLLIVGCCLLLTAALLIFSYFARPRQKEHISWKDAFVIGIAQACAVLPGLSRSGSTIATGLMLGNKKEKLAQFSFLMVIPPILGEALLDVMKAMKGEAVMGSIGTVPLLVGSMNFNEGAHICINKPYRMTSFGALAHIRYLVSKRLHVKRVKMGHAGTLDPLATGVLILCTGKATKQIEALQLHTKEYTATLQLGATTPSYDMEHEVDNTYPTEHITRELILETLPRLVGDIMQVPPAFSACMVAGDRAYDLARKGKEVELAAKPVRIDELELTDFNPSTMQMSIRVVCGKGTYIRSLARDIGQALGSGAYLTALCRTRVGDVRIEDAP